MKKNYFLIPYLMLGMILLPSCAKESSSSANKGTLEEDLVYLMNNPCEEFSDSSTYFFSIPSKKMVPYYEEGFYYTITIAYASQVVKGLHVIMVPESKKSDYYSNMTSVGYDFDITLVDKANEEDRKNGKFKGINVSYKSDIDDETFYLFVSSSSQETKEIFKISNFQ
ncbi:MAG: hypothetical protein ACI4U5_00655 [Bacilli bacterium]